MQYRLNSNFPYPILNLLYYNICVINNKVIFR